MLTVFPLGIILGIGLAGFSYYAGKTTEPNSAIGIRTKATLSSNEAWIAGHRAAKPWIFVSGITLILLMITGQILSWLGIAGSSGEYISLSGVFASIVILLIATNVANNSARKEM